MLKAVRHHTDCRWALLYIERWLKAPVQMEECPASAPASPTIVGHVNAKFAVWHVLWWNVTEGNELAGPKWSRLLQRSGSGRKRRFRAAADRSNLTAPREFAGAAAILCRGSPIESV